MFWENEMVRVFYCCCDFLYTPAVAGFMLTLAGAVWKRRVEERVQKIIWVATVIGVTGHNIANNTMISVLFSNSALLINIMLVSLTSTLIYCCKFRDAFCLIYLSWSTLALADFFIQTLVYTIREDIGLQPDIFLTVTVPRGIYLLIWAAVLLVPRYIVRGQGKWMQAEISRHMKTGWFLVMPLFVCMVYFQRIYKQMVSERLVYRWWLFLIGGMLLGLAVLSYNVVHKERERYWLLQQKTEMLEYNYRVMIEGNQEKAILLHDIRKHRLAIREMAEMGRSQDIVRYLDEMEQIPRKDRNQDLANHELLNLILNRKIREAEGLGIEVQFRVDDMCSLALTQMEICALFTNILDNAIESNQALAEEKGHWIKLDCARKGRMLVIFESNPMKEGKVRFVEGIPQTTKKNKWNHGLGMQSIKRVVESHGGHMQIDVKERNFQLVIYLEGFQ